MVVFLAVVVALFLVLLLAGAVTGRVKVRSCCAVADPRADARMRAAFEDPDLSAPAATEAAVTSRLADVRDPSALEG